MLPWLNSNQPADPLPRSLYPILPPPTPYWAAQAPPVSTSPLHPFSPSHLHLRSLSSSQDVGGTPLDLTTFNPSDLASNHDGNLEFQHENVGNDVDSDDSGSERELEPESSLDKTSQILGATQVLSVKERIAPIEAERAVTRPASPRRAAADSPAKPTWTSAVSYGRQSSSSQHRHAEIGNGFAGR